MDAPIAEELHEVLVRFLPGVIFLGLFIWIIIRSRKTQGDAIDLARRSVDLGERAVEIGERSMALQEETNRLLRELINKTSA